MSLVQLLPARNSDEEKPRYLFVSIWFTQISKIDRKLGNPLSTRFHVWLAPDIARFLFLHIRIQVLKPLWSLQIS